MDLASSARTANLKCDHFPVRPADVVKREKEPVLLGSGSLKSRALNEELLETSYNGLEIYQD